MSSCDDLTVPVRPDETVLEALLRQGVALPFSCRSGVCQACLLRCTAGEPPEKSQRGLSGHLVRSGHFLACQCRPSSSLQWARPLASDLRTRCVATALEGVGTSWLTLVFETERTLTCRPGDALHLVTGDDPGQHPLLVVTQDGTDNSGLMAAALHLPAGLPAPLAWMSPADEGGAADVLGIEFDVWRPAAAPPTAPGEEAATPVPDPALWHELGDGKQVREVLDAFYAQVYRDPQLAPFFEGVTPERAAGQQYAFLCQLMTGEKVYFGDRPRNAHHWMVISDALLDYRQSLMVATLQAHGLSPAQISRWTRFEEHFRRDMVKSAPFAKVQHGVTYPLDGFDQELLTSGSLCDHCGAEVAEGTVVLYHRRLGTISCPSCARLALRPCRSW